MRIVVLGGVGNFGARICRAPLLFRMWLLLGIPAFASVVTIVFLMVAKPLAVA